MIKHKVLVNPKSRESLKSLFDKIKEEPEEVEVFVCNKKFTRSKVQRGYYWGYIIKEISDLTGYEPYEVNEILKYKFNKIEISSPDSSSIWIGGSIERQSTKKVEEIYEKIRMWAAEEMDLVLMEPNQVPNEVYINSSY